MLNLKPGTNLSTGRAAGEVVNMNRRFSDYILAKYLHPVPIVPRFPITGGVDAVIIDGPQQLPHRKFVHQRLEFIFKRECRWLLPLLPFLRRSGRALGRLSDRVGRGVAQSEQMQEDLNLYPWKISMRREKKQTRFADSLRSILSNQSFFHFSSFSSSLPPKIDSSGGLSFLNANHIMACSKSLGSSGLPVLKIPGIKRWYFSEHCLEVRNSGSKSTRRSVRIGEIIRWRDRWSLRSDIRDYRKRSLSVSGRNGRQRKQITSGSHRNWRYRILTALGGRFAALVPATLG